PWDYQCRFYSSVRIDLFQFWIFTYKLPVRRFQFSLNDDWSACISCLGFHHFTLLDDLCIAHVDQTFPRSVRAIYGIPHRAVLKTGCHIRKLKAGNEELPAFIYGSLASNILNPIKNDLYELEVVAD